MKKNRLYLVVISLLIGIFILNLMVTKNNISVPINSNEMMICPASGLGENWTLAEVIASSASNVYLRDVATDSQGNIHLIYRRTGSPDTLYYKMWNNTMKTWIQRPSFNHTQYENIYLPRISVSPLDDSIHIVWCDLSKNLFYRNITLDSSVWSPSVQFNDYLDSYDDWEPVLAVDHHGIVHVFWQEIISITPPQRNMIYRSLNTSSGNWTSEMILYSGSDRMPKFIESEINSKNDLFVVFNDQHYLQHYSLNYMIRNGTTGVWDRNSANNNLGYIIFVGGDYGMTPKIAFDSKDNLHIVWRTNFNILYIIYNGTTETLMPMEYLTTDNLRYDSPQIVVDKDGGDSIHVVYSTQADKQGSGTDEDLFYVSKHDTDWSGEELVSHESTDYIGSVGIVMKSSISAPTVFWGDNTNYNSSGTARKIFSKSRISNMNIGSPVLGAIIPSNSSTGLIELNWSVATNATKYHIFRSLSPIENISNGFFPLISTNKTTYNETITTGAEYYYVIVASNKTHVSPVSNCESVIVDFLPVSNFTVNATSIAEWGFVNFTFIGDNGDPPTTYIWDFGDGSTSNDQNPIHQYTHNGTYTVTLNVTDADNDTVKYTKPDYIIVSNNPPVATFIANITSIHIGEWVEFNHTGDTGDGNLTYEWDFGDGFNSTEASPTHQYLLEGNYTITLKVMDADNDTDIYTRSNYIEVYNNIPVGSFVANISSIIVGGQVQFNYTGTLGDGNHTYMWIFGDGFNSTEANPTHQYNHAGTYTVSLIIVDADGDNSTFMREDYITVRSITQDTNPNIPCFPIILVFLGILLSYGLKYIIKPKKKF
ncbi:MAG: PKD domain-containing protein [Candidatus Lokiarchaeota archaeon]|nr:PKD domain-containing protein [Candidatus Lokiarchaeota archaeon]